MNIIVFVLVWIYNVPLYGVLTGLCKLVFIVRNILMFQNSRYKKIFISAN